MIFIGELVLVLKYVCLSEIVGYWVGSIDFCCLCLDWLYLTYRQRGHRQWCANETLRCIYTKSLWESVTDMTCTAMTMATQYIHAQYLIVESHSENGYDHATHIVAGDGITQHEKWGADHYNPLRDIGHWIADRRDGRDDAEGSKVLSKGQQSREWQYQQ